MTYGPPVAKQCMKDDEPYKRATKEDCLLLARYNFRCGYEYRMWQWLLEWATWEEDLGCTITEQYVGFDNFMDKVLEKNNG